MSCKYLELNTDNDYAFFGHPSSRKPETGSNKVQNARAQLALAAAVLKCHVSFRGRRGKLKEIMKCNCNDSFFCFLPMDAYSEKQLEVVTISSALVGGGLLLNPTTSSNLIAIRRERG